jgi:1-deoxyxylulose-5-phosphate synthase
MKKGKTMDYVRLGSSGLKVSQLGLGMMSYGNSWSQSWALDEDQAEPIVRRAVEAGITLFDTADMYSGGASEEITGRLLARLFHSREDYVLATKGFFPTGPGVNDRGLSRKHLLAAIDASLRRLRTDYVDLYQIHRFDSETPVEETMAALEHIVQTGKARYLGASAMYAWQFAKLQSVATASGWTRFIAMQNRYNLVNREDERELIPLCRDLGVGLLPYSPLARGLLAGTRERDGNRLTVRARVDRGDRAADYDVAEAVAKVASGREVPPAAIALAWILGKPDVSAPIVGATAIHHLDDAVAALEFSLSDEEKTVLEQPYLPRLMSDF